MECPHLVLKTVKPFNRQGNMSKGPAAIHNTQGGIRVYIYIAACVYAFEIIPYGRTGYMAPPELGGSKCHLENPAVNKHEAQVFYQILSI